jgi:lactoylglutathione lyase
MILLSLCHKLFNRSLLYLFTTETDPEKSPKVHIPALNHIGLWVDNLDSAFSSLTSKGIRFAGGIRKGAGRDKNNNYLPLCHQCFFLFFFSAGHNVAFIHPKSAEGVLVELVQAPKSMLPG